MGNEHIHIVVAADRNFLKPLYVTLFSLLTNLNNEVCAMITILTPGLDLADKIKIEQLEEKFTGTKIKVIKIIKGTFPKLSSDRWSETTLYRLLAPKILPNYLEKALYLDADTVILDDVSKLFQMDLGDNYLGAVEDYVGENTFNAGVLMFNLKRWRETNLADSVLIYLKKNVDQLPFLEQDALNVLCENKWHRLDSAWNVASHSINRAGVGFKNKLFFLKPRIIHFSGSKKVWQKESRHPYKRLYRKYAEMTDWSAFPKPGLMEKIARLMPFNAAAFLTVVLISIKNIMDLNILAPTREWRGKHGLRISQLMRQNKK